MAWALNLIYLLAWGLASPWLLWRRWRWGKNRRGWSQKWLGLGPVKPAERPRIWLHAVSVGEVNLLAPIITELSRRGDFEFAISTTTETGYELARQKYPEHFIFFCPFDFSWAVGRTLRNLRPDLIVLAELELWPNWTRAAQQLGIPLVVVNGRLSAKGFAGYQRCRLLVRGMFRRVSLVLAQSPEYAERFVRLGVESSRVVVAGNVKFDNVDPQRGRERAAEFIRRYGFGADTPILVGGSTQPDEERLLLSVFEQLREEFPSLRLVLVPRHPEKAPLLEPHLRDLPWTSEFRSQSNNRLKETQPDILVVDVIGELAAWWTLATVAYVGGSWGARGGQNMIEPAACGCVVCFGPNTRNFRDVVEWLLQGEAATVITTEAELVSLARQACRNPDWAREQGQRAARLVAAHRGASGRTAEQLLELLAAANPSDQSGSLSKPRAA